MTQNLYTKIINIPEGKEIFFYSVDKTNLLIASTFLDKKYVLIPDFVSFSKIGKNMSFTYKVSDQIVFDEFLFNLKTWLKNITRPFREKLFLKGLGFRVSISDDKDFLLLKLGYSHISSIEIPKKRISIKINKSSIIIEGFDAVEVGNFASKIRHLRIPDIYKGKGVWYKNEVKILKELKKK